MELLQLVGGRLKRNALIRQREASLILSHRVALMLLNRKSQDLPDQLRASGQLEVRGGRVSRRLERFAALAARLARLRSRDLPLPGRLHGLGLPVVRQVVDEAAEPVAVGPTAGSRVQKPIPAGSRPARPLMAAMQAPSRAVLVAAGGTRVEVRQMLALAEGQETRPPRTASRDAQMAVRQTRDTGLPAPQQRSAVAAIQAVRVVASSGSGGRAASVWQGTAPKALSVAMPLHAAYAADGHREGIPSQGTRRAAGRHAVLAGLSGSGRATALEIMQVAQAKAPEPAAVPAGAAALTAATSLAPPRPATAVAAVETPAPAYASGTGQRLAVLQRSVVSLPRSEPSRDILRRQVVPPAGMPNRPAAVAADSSMQNRGGSQQAACSPATSADGFGADAGRMVMVSLTGDVVIDGRRLGQVAASSQASRASLPAHGPSRVNLRAVPIHPGMQIPQ